MTTLIPKITVIGPRIIRILGCNPGPMTLQGTNTYLIGTGNRRVLLDTGEDKNEDYLTSLMSVLKQHNTTVDKIIITHWHMDHIGGLSNIVAAMEDQVSVYKFPRIDPEDSPMPATAIYIPLKHQDLIETEGATLRVHHTPGHTTDHVVVELEEEAAVFSGDCILGEGTTVFEDLHSYMASLKLILGMEPKVIYPGHGPVVEEPQTKINQYINHRNQREKQIMNTLNSSINKFLTPMELVKVIYKETPEHLHLVAVGNVLNHLKKLLKDKQVVQQGDTWCSVTMKGQL
ncbi:hypothetical protein Pmani_036440 [Petrolisthes manimaculis]|uniref:Beta-lactamase-like protein 2 homolog n=1 Tax=Petrolisthes manimaculis TaxID=1843537 RepID=A0AAE1NJB8_9EUCA|nr:hypothetical protein Pmani_036440 [Petrolisthes manimaculis]